MSQTAPNRALINEGFALLLQTLAPYVAQRLKIALGDDWRREVLSRLYDYQKRGLPAAGGDTDFVKALDINLCLLLLDLYWREVFDSPLGIQSRSWAKELKVIRDECSHYGSGDFDEDYAGRALDTMARLCGKFDPAQAYDIRALARRPDAEPVADEKPRVDADEPREPTALSWRRLIRPHPDVAQGTYRRAEFAADLALVSQGKGAPEYVDAREFYKRTYLTAGLKALLKAAVARLAGVGGEPVIQLKTPFGGGKTHSLLALYHMARSSANEIPLLGELAREAGVAGAPLIHTAVIVGTALDPSKSASYPEPIGRVNTVWGEIAAQLAISSGKPELFELVRSADDTGVSPGSRVLTQLLDEAGSCLILVDELVAYARKLRGASALPAGSFDNFLTFIQELTEAAKASAASIVAATIPESESEIGGQAGELALRAVQHHFGRVETVFQPLEASEGFEVVRRRLFGDCENPAERDRVCQAFAAMYRDNEKDFPPEAREANYLKRLEACYPFHPELFDRLYTEWTTLEKFQRTRGVLRLLASVVRRLWANGDESPLIMPGDLPLDAPEIREELGRSLSDAWNSIIDREVDGPNSVPVQRDRENPRYGRYRASRRAARTLLLGSAPTAREQNVRGLEKSRVLLGMARPGDEISVICDALHTLRDHLAYLYASGDRRWYDTRPTLRKLAEERAAAQKDDDVDYEIRERLKKYVKKTPPLTAIHVCPASPADVPDEASARLVVLGPDAPWSDGEEDNPARTLGRAILNKRGDGPRVHKNALVFLAADENGVRKLKEETRAYLAWKSVSDEREKLNLDQIQTKEAVDATRAADGALNNRLEDVWRVLLSPAIADRSRVDNFLWQPRRLSGNGSMIQRAAKKLVQDELIIESWASETMLAEVGDLLWQNGDELELKKLWGLMTAYAYLPRLKNFDVLAGAIEDATAAGKFGYADGFVDDRPVGIVLGERPRATLTGFIVRREKAEAELAARDAEREKREAGSARAAGIAGTAGSPGFGTSGQIGAGDRVDQDPRVAPPKYARFHLHARLDPARAWEQARRVVEEIAPHLEKNGEIEITLEIQAEAPDGFDPDAVTSVNENCDALGVEERGFETE